MTNLLIVFAIVLAVFAFLCIVLFKKQKKQENQPQYICSHCGDNHCECQKHDRR